VSEEEKKAFEPSEDLLAKIQRTQDGSPKPTDNTDFFLGEGDDRILITKENQRELFDPRHAAAVKKAKAKAKEEEKEWEEPELPEDFYEKHLDPHQVTRVANYLEEPTSIEFHEPEYKASCDEFYQHIQDTTAQFKNEIQDFHGISDDDAEAFYDLAVSEAKSPLQYQAVASFYDRLATEEGLFDACNEDIFADIFGTDAERKAKEEGPVNPVDEEAKAEAEEKFAKELLDAVKKQNEKKEKENVNQVSK